MRQNTQPEKQSLTPMQKQAVLVCIVCALAALLTIGITLVLIHRGKEPAASSEQPGTEQPADDANIADHYQINEQSSALLPETADAGDAYQSETLFIGDSNTVRLYANGLISLQQFCAKEGIGTSAALNEGIVTFKKDSSRYTIAEAVAKMKPRRVVIMLGTNDTGMAVEDFISNYKQLVQAIQTSYPYTDIIVNTVPPVPADHSNYPNMDQTRIDDFNMALLSMCEEMGLKFLNTAEALKDSTGYGKRRLLPERRHPPQDLRPEGAAELPVHPCLRDRGPPPGHQQHSPPRRICARSQLGGGVFRQYGGGTFFLGNAGGHHPVSGLLPRG